MQCEFHEKFDSPKHRLIDQYVMIARLQRMFLDRELSRSGVFRSQHQILMDIARFPNASQKEIAVHQHVSTATIAVSLKKLEKGGYIRRMMDKEDNRFNQICITPKGREVVEGSIQVFRRVEEASFASFTDEELEKFGEFLERVKLNVEYLIQENSFESRPDFEKGRNP